MKVRGERATLVEVPPTGLVRVRYADGVGAWVQRKEIIVEAK